MLQAGSCQTVILPSTFSFHLFYVGSSVDSKATAPTSIVWERRVASITNEKMSRGKTHTKHTHTRREMGGLWMENALPTSQGVLTVLPATFPLGATGLHRFLQREEDPSYSSRTQPAYMLDENPASEVAQYCKRLPRAVPRGVDFGSETRGGDGFGRLLRIRVNQGGMGGLLRGRREHDAPARTGTA